MYAQSSIELLKTAGIDFHTLSQKGIDPAEFGYLLISSGLVLNENIKWIRCVYSICEIFLFNINITTSSLLLLSMY